MPRCRQIRLCPLILLLDIDIGVLFIYKLTTFILIVTMLARPAGLDMRVDACFPQQS
jgi:hypothetical protein